MMISSCTEVARAVAEKQLLEVSIIEDIWVHSPSRVWAFSSASFETKSVGSTHEGNKVLRSQVQFLQAFSIKTIVNSFFFMMDSVFFSVNDITSHPKYHLRTTAIFYSSVTTKLN